MKVIENTMFKFLVKSKTDYLIVFLLALAFFSFLQSAPVMSDPDGFYHAKVSMLISEQGIIKSFPWLQQTSLKENYTDHHFLYHLFLIPFVKFSFDSFIFPNSFKSTPSGATKILFSKTPNLTKSFFKPLLIATNL